MSERPDSTVGDGQDHAGRCLCGRVGFSVDQPPSNVAICFCRFCQRLTGSDYMVEPIFDVSAFKLLSGDPATYQHRSEGSGKRVTVHFCSECGTALFHRFERFPTGVGVFAGTFDDPSWFERSPENVDYIFLASAPRGAVIPAGYRTFSGHFLTPEGEHGAGCVFQEHRHFLWIFGHKS